MEIFEQILSGVSMCSWWKSVQAKRTCGKSMAVLLKKLQGGQCVEAK
jgi:hypothetical protein